MSPIRKLPRYGIPGYRRIPGDKARRYIDPHGKIISRRQYLKEKRTYSFEGMAVSNELYAKFRRSKSIRNKMNRYNDMLASYAEHHGITKGEARKSEDFRRTYQIIATQVGNDYRPNSELRKALTHMGKIENSWGQYVPGMGIVVTGRGKAA